MVSIDLPVGAGVVIEDLDQVSIDDLAAVVGLNPVDVDASGRLVIVGRDRVRLVWSVSSSNRYGW